MVSIPIFWKHVGTVLTGTVAAQALPLLVAPLITRLCTPADMGEFGVWLGVIAIASIAATLRLEMAMILDHGSEQQQVCFSVVAYSATTLAIVLTLCASIARLWGLPLALHLSWFALLTLGIGMWLTAYMQAVLAYATSYHAFGKAAQAKVWTMGTIAFTQLGLLILGAGETALLAGQIIGLAIGLTAAFRLMSPPRPTLSIKPTDSQWTYLKKNQGFWQFSLPAGLLNAVGARLPLFFIGAKYGLLAAGLYALTERVLTAPIALLATSVLEVFKRQSVQDFQSSGNCKDAYQHAFKVLALLGFGPALFTFVFAPDLFAFVFGESWREAGEFARILAPIYFLSFIASPLSYVFLVVGEQKVDLAWQVVLFMMTISVFLAPLSLKKSLWYYSIGYSLLYLVYLCLSYRAAQSRRATT